MIKLMTYPLFVLLILTIYCQNKCYQFSQTECQKNECLWNRKINKCEQKNRILTISSNRALYCNNIGDQQKCIQTYGCAFYEHACSMFLGCTAYTGYSQYECENISYLCTWIEFDQLCSRNTKCTKQNGCNEESNYDCTNAPLRLQSQGKCWFYSTNCLFNGISCMNSLPLCYQYQIDDPINNCQFLNGIDGQCLFDSNNKCRAKYCQEHSDQITCTQLPTNQLQHTCYYDNGCYNKVECEKISQPTTQNDCNIAIQSNCYFDGQKCVLQLDNCSSKQNSSDCDNTIGIDGICQYQNGQCQILECTDPKYQDYQVFNTYCQSIYLCTDNNQQCSQKTKSECVTNINCVFYNNRCVKKVEACETYSVNQCPSNQCNKSYIFLKRQQCLFAMSQTECESYQQFNNELPCYWDEIEQYCSQVEECKQIVDAKKCQLLSQNCFNINNQCKYLEKCEEIPYNLCENISYCFRSQGKCYTYLSYCNDYLTQGSCYITLDNSNICVWTGNKCKEYKEPDDIYDESECTETTPSWIFNSTSYPYCQPKKHCFQLSLTDYGIEGYCQTYYNPLPTKCSDYIKEEECYNSSFECFWESEKCTPIEKCSNLSTLDRCNKYNDQCVFSNQSCQASGCSYFQLNCEAQKFQTIFQEKLLCRYFGTYCLEVAPYDEETCDVKYNGSYTFQDGYCVNLSDQNATYSQPRITTIPLGVDFIFQLNIIIFINLI